MPMKPHRALTSKEQEIAQHLVARAARDASTFVELVRELVVYRETVPILRKQRRCLPRHAQEALDALPHYHATAVEFSRD